MHPSYKFVCILCISNSSLFLKSLVGDNIVCQPFYNVSAFGQDGVLGICLSAGR